MFTDETNKSFNYNTKHVNLKKIIKKLKLSKKKCYYTINYLKKINNFLNDKYNCLRKGYTGIHYLATLFFCIILIFIFSVIIYLTMDIRLLKKLIY